jgi:hypothetical protein
LTAARSSPSSPLSPRALNRALLARQLLLSRANLPPLAALDHLAGLQAQLARPPFIGLWTRLAGFERAKKFPKFDERALGYAVRMCLPVVQVPTDDPWAFPGAAAFADASTWLDAPVPVPVAAAPSSDPPAASSASDLLVRRYLAAFGPVTVRDAQRWSGLADLSPVFERLRPSLLTFRDDKKRELFDLPGAPRPPPDAPAPVRFVPDFDNLVLGHDDRRRIIADEHRPQLTIKNLQLKATFLVDGFVAGTWKIERTRRAASLVLSPFGKLSRAIRAPLEEEGEALLSFVEPDAASRSISVAPA